jgi:phage gp29-like protein
MADDERDAPPEFREIATTRDGLDITRGYVEGLGLLAPGDSVLREHGSDYDVYRDILRDDQVKPVWEQRRLAVVSREWEVIPGGKRAVDRDAADALREDLEQLNWDAVTDKMLYGVVYGYAVAECLYAPGRGRVRLAGIKVRRQKRFAFTPMGDELRLLTMTAPQGIALPPRKFWTFTVGSDHDDEPYGLGLGHWWFWPVFFKRGTTRLWLYALEKSGAPTAVGEFPPNARPEEKARLLRTLEALQRDSGVILPQGFRISLLEALKYASTEHAALYDRMNAAISKIGLGQTMTTDDGSSMSQAQVHWSVRQDLVAADASVLCESFNRGPARWLTAWNFPNATPPKVWRRLDEAPDLKALSEVQANVYRFGYRPTLPAVISTYGGEWERVDAPAAEPPPGPAFAGDESDPDPVDPLSDQLEEAARPLMDGLLEPVRALLARAGSLEEFRDGLLDAYAQQPIGELGALLQQALTVAELTGRWKVDRGE